MSLRLITADAPCIIDAVFFSWLTIFEELKNYPRTPSKLGRCQMPVNAATAGSQSQAGQLTCPATTFIDFYTREFHSPKSFSGANLFLSLHCCSSWSVFYLTSPSEVKTPCLSLPLWLSRRPVTKYARGVDHVAIAVTAIWKAVSIGSQSSSVSPSRSAARRKVRLQE